MTKGFLLLEGGAEFGGRMADPDRRALELAGGYDAALSILPTAAAPDHNHQRAGQNGQRWFESLGARQVAVLPVIDRASADSPENAAAIQNSRLVYLLGGFTHFLGQTLSGSRCSQAMNAALPGRGSHRREQRRGDGLMPVLLPSGKRERRRGIELPAWHMFPAASQYLRSGLGRPTGQTAPGAGFNRRG